MDSIIDLSAPIEPNLGLGGLRLRCTLSAMSDLVTGLGVTRIGSYNLVNPFEARYSFGDGSVQCAVDVRNGKVFKLIAAKNYKGKFEDLIYVGLIAKDAFSLDQRLFYSEADESILCRGVEGIVFDVPIVDPDPSDVPLLPISSISVYAIEAFTADGQEGNW